MIHYLGVGILLGLSAGMAPGPLLALVVSETLQNGVRAGIQVALSPIITDLPVILLTLYLLTRLADIHVALGIISLSGGAFLLYTGCQDLFRKAVALETNRPSQGGSLARGVLINALSPHPYLFWLTVGTPTLTTAMAVDVSAAAAFIASFYLGLIGFKVVLAILVGRARPLFKSRAYLVTLRLLGGALCLFALFFFLEGLRLLKFH